MIDDLITDGTAAEDTAIILEFIKRKLILGCTSPKTLMDIYYLFHSEKGATVANRRVKQIYALMDITAQTAQEVREAFALGWTDFEDAMQMTSAKSAGAFNLITLDKKFLNIDKAYLWTPADLRGYLIQHVRNS